ncbi:MAG: hypothetical protein ACRENU_01895 [Gemmatimonadaceae bacterium]
MKNRLALILAAFSLACATASTASTAPTPLATGSIAQVYYWKARPGLLDAYNRYILEVAEPIDAEAQKQNAFVSVTTYQTRDTLSPWTHMRVFILRDSAQLQGLGAALDAAGRKLEPDSVKRRVRGEYAATLRDRVGGTILTIVH